MSMDREEFKNAFREVISQEFAHIPSNEDEIDYTFSDEFLRKTERIFKPEKKPFYKVINTVSKRVAVVFLAIITLFAASMGIGGIREPVKDFFVGFMISGGDTSSSSSNTSSHTLPEKYNAIPSDLTEVVSTPDKTEQAAIYEDSKGNTVILTKSATQETKVNLDTADNNVNVENVDGLEVVVVSKEQQKDLIWVNDGFYCQVTAYGSVNDQTLTEFVKAVK